MLIHKKKKENGMCVGGEVATLITDIDTENDHNSHAQLLVGSITSRCSGKEPALLPERVDQTRESGGNRA